MELKHKLKSILEQYPVVFGYIFGSQATKKTGPLSDLDLAVFFEKSITPKRRQELRFKMEQNLSKKLKIPVEVIPLNDAQPVLEKEVVYKGELIYSKNETARTHYEARAISRWLDWKYYQEKINKSILSQMEKPIKAS